MPGPGKQFPILRTDPALTVERRRLDPYLEKAPDKTLAFAAEMDMAEPELTPGATLVYACPMHPDVVRQVPGHCPKCGMKLLATEAPADDTSPPAESDHEMDPHQHHGSTEGIGWEDDMVEVNKTTTPANMHWNLVDRATGNENTAIGRRVRVLQGLPSRRDRAALDLRAGACRDGRVAIALRRAAVVLRLVAGARASARGRGA